MGLFAVMGCTQAPGTATDDAAVAQTVDAAVAQTVAANASIETAVAQTVASSEVAQAEDLPATSTVAPEEPTAVATEPPPATNTAVPTVTTAPTDTPVPVTDTPEPTAVPPTNTPAPVVAQPTAPPAQPTQPPAPEFGQNILVNGSFEDGWYNLNGIAELQIPNGWIYQWDEGPTGFGTEDWDVWVRPETRVLPDFQLPSSERALFIRDGVYTIKMFKGSGAISYRLFQDIELAPGTYVLEVNIYPDLVIGYEGGQKVAPGDPASGEIRFITPDGGTGWILPAFAQWNTVQHIFTVEQGGVVQVGLGVRGRYALNNNGWFLDQWSLRRIEN